MRTGGWPGGIGGKTGGGHDQIALYICMKFSKNELKDLTGIF